MNQSPTEAASKRSANGAFALTCFLVFTGAAASAEPRPARTSKIGRAEARRFYQSGVDQYAYGRFSQALASFQEAVRRDPNDRAARVAVARVRQELAMTAVELAPPPRPRPAPEPDDSILGRFVRFWDVDSEIGDERAREGQLHAMQGRIAQLLVEKKIARETRRVFAKDAELHALSRRLS